MFPAACSQDALPCPTALSTAGNRPTWSPSLPAQVSSLSVEEHPGSEIVVSLFEVEASPASISAFIEREHEFR